MKNTKFSIGDKVWRVNDNMRNNPIGRVIFAKAVIKEVFVFMEMRKAPDDFKANLLTAARQVKYILDLDDGGHVLWGEEYLYATEQEAYEAFVHKEVKNETRN